MTSTDVVICVHGALDVARKCIDSVLDAGGYARVWIVDDRNTADDRQLLDGYVGENVSVLAATGSGYTCAANTALRVSTADAICLLNSDTVVPANWLPRLIKTLSACAHTGLAGPWSNAASWQSLPRDRDWRGRWVVNEPQRSVQEIDADVAIHGANHYPSVRVLNGFCLLIDRRVITRIGLLDEDLFPDGYGEENDYCLRAEAAGFEMRVAGDLYVYHEKSASYGNKLREKLSVRGHRALVSRYGTAAVRELIRDMRRNRELKLARRAAARAFQ